jgi:hypothetical protein
MSPGKNMPPSVIHIKLISDIQFRPIGFTREPLVKKNRYTYILEFEAAKRREKIKAVSTKYSEMWTDISGSDGIVIDTSRYDML